MLSNEHYAYYTMLAYSAVDGLPPALTTDPKILDYLAQRGITLELAIQLHLKVLPAAQLMQQAKPAAPAWQTEDDKRLAIVFPHFSIDGSVLDWWSARLVQGTSPARAASSVRSFADYADPDAPSPFGGKMFCPPGEPPCAYLPQAPGMPDWSSIPKGSTIFIHESAIKAVNGARLGFYSIGLNGVWGWASKRHELAILPQLKLLWKELELNPVILFDTNLATNQQVEHSAIRLAAKLHQLYGRTAKILRMHRMPEVKNGEDYGFDDFAVAVGDAHARAFLSTPLEDLEDVDVGEIELMKQQLSADYCVITSICKIGRIRDAALYSSDGFISTAERHKVVYVDTANGGSKKVLVAQLWLEDPRRTTVEALSYHPDLPRLCTVDGVNYLNTWGGWGTVPQPGPVDLWLDLVVSSVKSAQLADWFINWLAYPLQHPGKKLHSYPLLYGEQGTGKDRVLAPIHQIYGKANFSKVGSKNLTSSFNSVYAEKQFIHADEVKSQRFTADDMNQVIKGLVTDETIVVNRKNQQEYIVKNMANLVITSNYIEGVKLDDGDRRATVINWRPIDPNGHSLKDNTSYWDAYSAWVDDNGPAYLFHYLLQRDLSSFNPHGWAFFTEEKAQAIEAGRSSLESFVYRLKVEPDLELPALAGARQLFSSKALAEIFHGTKEVLPAMVLNMGRELTNAGFKQANNAAPIRYKVGADTKQERMWIVPRPDLPHSKQVDFSISANCIHHLKVHAK